MYKEYKYPAHRCLRPSPFFDKDYVISSLTQAFHLIFGLSVGIGIGMVMCGVTRAICIVIISALGYLGTETDAWFYLPACIFRLIRNDYPRESDGLQKAIEWAKRYASPASDSFDLHLSDDFLGEKADLEMENDYDEDEDEDEDGLNGCGAEEALTTDDNCLCKLLFGMEKDRQDAIDYIMKKSGPEMEETPKSTKEEKEDGRIQSEDDGRSESMDGT